MEEGDRLMRRTFFFLAVLVSASAVGACKDDLFEDTCRGYCGYTGCVGDQNANAYEGCVDKCGDWPDAASEVSDACRAAFEAGIDCVAALGCGSKRIWVYRSEHPGEPYPCQEETEAFEEACTVGVWYLYE